jgi:hypothetical protein
LQDIDGADAKRHSRAHKELPLKVDDDLNSDKAAEDALTDDTPLDIAEQTRTLQV